MSRLKRLQVQASSDTIGSDSRLSSSLFAELCPGYATLFTYIEIGGKVISGRGESKQDINNEILRESFSEPAKSSSGSYPMPMSSIKTDRTLRKDPVCDQMIKHYDHDEVIPAKVRKIMGPAFGEVS